MPIEKISDTARWMAYARSMETERPDALFNDPFARRLAGAHGEAIAREIGNAELIARGIAVRTAVMDELILEAVGRDNVDLILNVGSGLDTRPWRLSLPCTLRWVDVDLPEILDYKGSIVDATRATCLYEAKPADIANPGARASALAQCGQAQRALVVTEGLLVYLSPGQVSALARDLAAQAAFKWWLTDLTGPRALEMLRRVWGPRLRGAEFQFAPADSAGFFAPLGWREHLFRSSRDEAKRLNRSTPTPLLSRIMLKLSSDSFKEEFRRLSGVALLARDM